MPARWQDLAELGQGSSGGCIWPKSTSNMWWLFFPHSTESRGRKAASSLTITPNYPLAEFLSHPSDLILCESRGLSSKMGNASTRKDKNYPIELELNTAVWPFRAPHASESMGKEGSYCAGWVVSPDFLLPRENWTATPQWK